VQHTALRESIEEIRRRVDIVELIGRDVNLIDRGSYCQGSSPFNPDRTPSFNVLKDSQCWKDHSGGGSGSGDCFAYLQRRDNLSFMEAVGRLAAETGVVLPGQGSQEAKQQAEQLMERRKLEALLTDAAAYYHEQLSGGLRRMHCADRYGFTDEIVDRLEIGWADGGLYQHLSKGLGVCEKDAMATGLFRYDPAGKPVDFFERRLVFPYWRGGRVAYFIARKTELTPDTEFEQAKYKKLLTHSERRPYISPLMANDTFYGEDSVRGARAVLITEGVTDCISAMQAGVPCISPVTTRFRAKDVPRLLRLTRHAEHVVICNDSEDSGAGEAGARATAEALFTAGRDVRLAQIRRGAGQSKLDLNDLARREGGDAIKELMEDAKPYVGYLIDAVPRESRPAELERRLRPVFDAIATLSGVQQARFLDQLQGHLSLGRRVLNQGVLEARQRAAKSRAQEDARPEDASSRPEIYIEGQQRQRLIQTAQRVLVESNDALTKRAVHEPITISEPSPLFVRDGRLVSLRPSRGGLSLVEVTEPQMMGVLVRMADWYKPSARDEVKDTTPDRALVQDLLAFPAPGIQPIEAVIDTPIFGKDGELLAAPGYHPSERLWLQPGTGLGQLEIPPAPSDNEILAAKRLLLDELLGDFPFVDPGDRAHALAALLLPFARRMVDGFTPLHLVEAPTPGSGKGLLCDLIAILATGRACEARSLPGHDDEIRKMVTAELSKSRPIVLLDNIKERKTLDSSALAAVVTTDPWTDRILGESRMVSLPNKALWLITGNNPALSDELTRRCVRIRIDAQLDQPWRRTGFRHDPITTWAKAHRPRLVSAALTLIQAWVSAGRPAGAHRLGSFESWSQTVGGILEVAGVTGFLTNLDALYAECNAQRQAWDAFITTWWTVGGGDTRRVRELDLFCEEHDLLVSVRGDGNDRSRQIRLGKALGQMKGKTHQGRRIVLGEDLGAHKGRRYRLEAVASDGGSQAPAGDASGMSLG